MSATMITARTSVPGLHCWPGAPERRAYLRSLHRHDFRVEVVLELGHDDREAEFHDVAEWARSAMIWLGEEYHDQSDLVLYDARSCEMLATQLAELARQKGWTPVKVTVSEDGENDGTWIR